MILKTRIGPPPPGNPAGGLAREVMGAAWRRERCLLAAGAVLARTVAVEHRLENVVDLLPIEALTDHPMWNCGTVYTSPADGVPGVLDAGLRAALIGELGRVEPVARRLETAVQQLQLVGGQTVCAAAFEISEHAWDARFAVETCPGRDAAADAVDCLCRDRAQLVAAVRAELGLPPRTGPSRTSGPDGVDLW
jgi:hypothetical protein